MSPIIISVCKTSEEVFVTRKGVKRNNCAPKFYAIPRYVAALLKKPVV